MKLLEQKSIVIAIKNTKEKFRTWQSIFFGMGFPIMFTIIFYFMFHEINPETGIDIYSYSIPGMITYAASMGTTSAAIVFTKDKSTGILERLDTMPTGRKNIFLGTLISESAFLTAQILVMFILGYGILGQYFVGFIELIIGFFVSLLFGILSVGIGIIIASFSKNAEVADGIALTFIMPVIFASGAMVPFESPIVYFMPPYWAKQIYLQFTVLGDGLTSNLYSSSLIGYTATETTIPIWGGILILIALTVSFIFIGIKLFQKKTKL
ncbi:ABC transporter permease [Promethearchaeum syntrophicum]|uniref:ABC transporter permease n=1 Tax=Promethearchaeum syntrophicum TaxID=2594042 RepID=A0A5B9D9S7_9ARCH|nr:ABC transporter permease [Candidatus Prometheoarchaeum syntrophicum]QEE15969.1 ABC-2 type transporter [Candidatus Prometheoarchaeum syntrophicum]